MSPDEIALLAMPELQEAEEKLVMISQEERLRIQHEQWDKAQRDQLALQTFQEDWIEHWKQEGRQEGQRLGRDEGLQQGQRLGRDEGLQQGRRQGRDEGLALAILTILESRGVPVSEDQRRQLLSCQDEARLKQDLLRAGHVPSTEDLLNGGS